MIENLSELKEVVFLVLKFVANFALKELFLC